MGVSGSLKSTDLSNRAFSEFQGEVLLKETEYVGGSIGFFILGVSKNRGGKPSKMDGENNGTPY